MKVRWIVSVRICQRQWETSRSRKRVVITVNAHVRSQSARKSGESWVSGSELGFEVSGSLRESARTLNLGTVESEIEELGLVYESESEFPRMTLSSVDLGTEVCTTVTNAEVIPRLRFRRAHFWRSEGWRANLDESETEVSLGRSR